MKKIDLNLKEKFNEVYIPLLDNKNRFLFLQGSAGSGKSFFAVSKLLYRCIVEKNHKFCIARKVQRTIRHSVFALFTEILSDWGLYNLANINKTDLTITLPDFNSELIFIGIDDPEKLKSLQGITGFYIEEITELTLDDLLQINLRLRGKFNNYFQILSSFNPINSSHWIKTEYFDIPDDNTYFFKTTYNDNRFIDDNYKTQLESFKEKNEYYYQVYSLGEWALPSDLVFTNWKIEDLSEYRFDYLYFGLDFGYSEATAIIKVAFKNDTVFILDEIKEKKLGYEEIANKLRLFAGNRTIYCDCAEPRGISELRNFGCDARAVKKGADSLIHGIEWIKIKKMIINKTCIEFIKEIQSYSYGKDKNGIMDKTPIDFNQHLIDSLRYSLENIMLRRVIRQPSFSASSIGL